MAGRAGRTYKRDANGRFASTGGGGSKRPAAKRVAKGPNKVTRDNAGRITSVGGDGATMRGGRLRTAGGKLRATQTARVKSPGAKAGTIAKGGRGVSGAVARSLAAVRKDKAVAAKQNQPVVFRGKQKAIAAQKARTRQTIEATRDQVIGAVKGVTATAGGGERIRVKKARSTQLTLGGGTEPVTRKTVKQVASRSGPAPGSKASRRMTGVTRRASETALARLKRVKSRVAGSSDPLRPKPSISERRKASYRAGVVTNGKMKKALATENRAFRYVLGQIDQRSRRDF